MGGEYDSPQTVTVRNFECEVVLKNKSSKDRESSKELVYFVQ